MTTYFVPPTDQEEQRQFYLAQCRDIILQTANYLETYYVHMGSDAIIPEFTDAALLRIMPGMRAVGIPLTVETIHGISYFTAFIHLCFPHWDRRLVYYPVIPGTWLFDPAYVMGGGPCTYYERAEEGPSERSADGNEQTQLEPQEMLC